MANPARPVPSPSPAAASSESPSHASAPAPSPVAETSPVHDEPVLPLPALVEPEVSIGERGLRGLVGPGSSQVSPAAALRARDAARPRPEDLARAESELTIIRRNWSPRD